MKPHVLVTKLHPPAPNPKAVERERLIQQLNQGLEAGRSLSLVSALAGFGKSSCVSEWVRHLALPVAWLSLDAADDDPARFFTYVVASLQKIDEELGRELDSILESGQDPPAQAIFTALLDELERYEGRFLLVLDDFQVIQERAILDVLEILVTNIPPQLHLVIVTREDPPIPLARLRANNQMTEIRAEQLHFTSIEAGSFFNKTMDLTLSSQDLGVLQSRIEGWVAGLQLAGLSIQGRAFYRSPQRHSPPHFELFDRRSAQSPE
jgi:LuxR family maltose regulon positive regulatory protein